MDVWERSTTARRVYRALSWGSLSTLIDTALCLRLSRVEDKVRCEVAGVPSAARRAKSKPGLALEMVRHNRRLRMRFSWVGMDGPYCNDPALLRALEDDGPTFRADVHKDQHLYLGDPRQWFPPPPLAVWAGVPGQWLRVRRCGSMSGPRPKRNRPGRRSPCARAPKVPLRREVLHQRVWPWDCKESPGATLAPDSTPRSQGP